jgi:hypothetical protein
MTDCTDNEAPLIGFGVGTAVLWGLVAFHGLGTPHAIKL